MSNRHQSQHIKATRLNTEIQIWPRELPRTCLAFPFAKSGDLLTCSKLNSCSYSYPQPFPNQVMSIIFTSTWDKTLELSFFIHISHSIKSSWFYFQHISRIRLLFIMFHVLWCPFPQPNHHHLSAGSLQLTPKQSSFNRSDSSYHLSFPLIIIVSPLTIWASLVAQMVKNLPRFDPWIRKIPWRRAWPSTPVSLPREFHGQRSLVGYSPWGHKESDATFTFHTTLLQFTHPKTSLSGPLET